MCISRNLFGIILKGNKELFVASKFKLECIDKGYFILDIRISMKICSNEML